MNATLSPRAKASHDHQARPTVAVAESPQAAIPELDPVAQMLAEDHHESTLTRLVLCAALSVGLLALAGGLLV